MLSIAETKEVLGDGTIPNEEAQRIRDACYAFAEVALESFRSARREAKKTKASAGTCS